MNPPTATPAPPPRPVAPSPGFIPALQGLWTLQWRLRTARPRLVKTLVGIALGLLLVLASSVHRIVFYNMVVSFYFALCVPLACLVTCGAMIREEMEERTIGFLITRPVPRWQLFLAKYLVQAAWLQILLLVVLVGLMVVGTLRGVPELGGLFLTLMVAQALVVPAWGALAALLGLAHARYVIFGIVYWLVVEVLLQVVPTGIHNLSLANHSKTILAQHDALHDTTLLERIDPSDLSVGTALFFLGLLTAVYMAASTALFHFREYLPGPDSDQS